MSRAANVPVLLNLNSLSGIADQLVWLQLSNSGLQDTVLEILGELPNLRKLNLSKNNISDIGVNYLTGLAHLEYSQSI
ncbi:MAG: hypothetical protein IPG82_11295 [Saprospiraceae bacterium]|nr:hypothetical protein [Saprospiraceae bacterium]